MTSTKILGTILKNLVDGTNGGEQNLKRQKLIDFRGEKTQAEMANNYGVSQQLWSAWEIGTSTPQPHIMKRLENDVGVPMEDIFFDVFNRETR